MSRCRVAILVWALVCLAAPSHAQPADPLDPPLENWTAPPYWTPPAADQARRHLEVATGAAENRGVSIESTSPGTILPFTAITPCRLVDSRHGPKDVQQPGGSTPGYPRGSYASGETRSYDLTLGACTGLPAGVGAWSLQFQFVTATQPAFLEVWPYASSLGIGAQVVPASQSTMLGYTDRWTAMSAIIPAGDDADGSIDVYAQYAGDVIVQVNGYYAATGVVNSIAGLSGVVGMTGGTGITVSISSNTLTITDTGGSGGLLPTGTTGQTLYRTGSAWTASSALTNDGTNVGVSGILNLPNTTASTGYIALGGGPFLHNYGPANAGNTFVGQSSGNFSMTGISNTAAGSYALAQNASGKENTAIGWGALNLNTAGSYNSASGFGSLNQNTTASDNTASGFDALAGNTTASKNTAVGSSALLTQSYSNSNTAWDSNNTAVGYGALYSNQPTSTGNGVDNTAVGAEALEQNTTGLQNAASGYESLYANSLGSQNTASGFASLYGNTTADGNTAVGAQALSSQSFGNSYTEWSSYNTAVGYQALYYNQPNSTSNGIQNTVVGSKALMYNTTGLENTAIGANSGSRSDSVNAYGSGTATFVHSTTGSFNTFLGYGTGATAQVDNCTAVGVDAYCTATNQVRLGNVYVSSIGGEVAWSNLSDIRAKTNVRDVSLGLDFVLQLRPVEYQLRTGNGRTDMGFVAQDIEALLGEGYNVLDIGGDANRTLSLRTTDLMAPMVKAIQEQQATIQAQQAEIEALRAKVAEGEGQRAQLDAVTARLAALEKALAAMR